MGTKIVPKNIVEEFIDSKLDEIIAQSDICTCDFCRADVWACALNNLAPKYAVSISGDVHSRFAMLSDQAKADVTAEIIKAVQIVSKNPHYHSNEYKVPEQA